MTAYLPIPEMRAALDRLARQERPIARRALEIGAQALLSEAQRESPVRTGLLQNQHFAAPESPDEWLIGANTEYALPVHERHPSRRRWFLNAVKAHFERIFEGALRMALRERAP